jgi:hypothetical protein
MDQTKNINTPINITHRFKTIYDYNQEKITLALQKISKIRSIRLRNHMLRVVNGDIYSKERMERFGMITENKCDRCGDIETKEHLILECAEVSKIWNWFNCIHQKIHRRPYQTNLLNILNCGENYNSIATTTIVAELVKHLVVNRPVMQDESKLESFIKAIVKREKDSCKFYKIKLDKTWYKWAHLDIESQEDRGVLAPRHVVNEGLHQLPPAVGQVEDDGDAEPSVAVLVTDVVALHMVP